MCWSRGRGVRAFVMRHMVAKGDEEVGVEDIIIIIIYFIMKSEEEAVKR